MYPKHKTKKLVDLYRPIFIKKLGLEDWTIDIRILRSGAKSLARMNVDPSCWETTHAFTDGHFNKKAVKIILFYDTMASERGVISTLFHELLHCYLSPLHDLLEKQNPRSVIEENFIRRVEKAFFKSLKNG